MSPIRRTRRGHLGRPEDADGSVGGYTDRDRGETDGGDSGDSGDPGDPGDAGDIGGADDSAGGMKVGNSGGAITSTKPGSAGAKSNEKDRDSRSAEEATDRQAEGLLVGAAVDDDDNAIGGDDGCRCGP